MNWLRWSFSWLPLMMGISLAAPLAAEQPTPAETAEIARLIAQLSSDKFAERQAASKRLDAIGEPALEALRKAAGSSTDVEVRRRADQLLRTIQARVCGLLHCFTGHQRRVICLAISRDSTRILSGGDDKLLRLWDVKTRKELLTMAGHTDGVSGVAFSPDGRRAVSCSFDCTARLWDLGTGKHLRTFTGHKDGLRKIVFSPDGRHVLSGGNDRTMRLWDVDTGKELEHWDHPGPVPWVSYARDGRQAVSTCKDRLIRLWDMTTRKEVRRYAGHTAPVQCAVISADGRRLLSGGNDNSVRLWDLETGKELRRFQGHKEVVWSVALSPDGRRALSGSGGKALSQTEDMVGSGSEFIMRYWDVASGREIYAYEGHQGAVTEAAFFPDGRRALSSADDGRLRLWALPR